jgi:hypothetical protein
MNLKTTLILAILVVVGGISWLVFAGVRSGGATSETLNVLENELTPDRITRIEVKRGEHPVVLEKSGGEWTLPGKWPVRQPAVDELVRVLTGLRSRFAPVTVTEQSNLRYGFGEGLRVNVRAGDKDYALLFGEERDEANRFSRPTYLRLDDSSEAVRLAPGLVAVLNRPQEYYMQRRLFPAERVAREGDSAEKVEQLAATAVAVKGGGADYTLARAGDDWELRQPVHDHPDPDKLKAVLTALPDVWAERFVEKKGKDLAEFGLKEPEQTLSVTRPGGATVTLLVGKQSDMRTRIVPRPTPPIGGMPQKPQVDIVHEEFKFAKLRDNEQVFEIKADKLKDVAVATDVLRDPQLARFRTEDVKRVEVNESGRQLVFVKDKDKWRLEKPLAVEAESGKVTELLDKLSGLQARDKDIIDKADPKAYGLGNPATVKVTAEIPASRERERPEEASRGRQPPEGAKPAKTKEFTFALGKHDEAQKKLYVQMAGWPRVNLVEDSLLKLVQRPALAYRNRRVLDFSPADLAKVEVQRGGESFTLEQVKNNWRLAAPVQADVDSLKADQLADNLGRLDAVEFVTDNAKPEDLDKVYGLAKLALTAKVIFSDDKKPAQTVLVGKQRPGKPEYYAKLASDPAVFVVKKDAHEALDKDSLAYRPLEMWRLLPEDIAELGVRKGEPEYRLKREGESWQITGPFEAAAAADRVKPMTEALAILRGERYVAHTAKDLGTYGLDKPYLRLALKTKARSNDEDKPPAATGPAKDEARERVLLIGKPTEKDARTRFARLGDGEAVFVVGEKTLATVDHGALDLLDPRLLRLDLKAVQQFRRGGDAPFTLQRDKDGWRVEGAPAPPFTADRESVADTLRAWSDLRARRFAAYGNKVDLAAFGLDKPAQTVTVTLQPPADKDKPAKPVEHTLAFGKPAEGKGERYARLDQGPGVVVLDAEAVAALNRTYLDYVNRSVLKLDADKVTELRRRMGGDELEVVKRKEGWRLVKPADLAADGPTVDALLGRLAELRAKRVAAFPAKELGPFGLAEPAAVVTLRLGEDKDKAAEHVVQIGKVADEKGSKGEGDRFARVDKSDAVVVLPGSLAQQLIAAPLRFRDRDIARLASADKVVQERGGRKAVFTRSEQTWKMTEPVEAEAEQLDLEDFLKGLTLLRADELVADKPADLKPYGLDRPRVRWRFLEGDKEVLSLLVGSAKGVGQSRRAYAKLAAGDLVFLLDPQQTARALGEYRSRKVWTPPDAAQAERLRYGYENNPFVLEKVENTWQVAGKPDAAVNADAVRDALDALARLQAERYVADKGADLKVYGLDRPNLVLEVESPSGKQALHVGRQEGGSKRYYATVPGAAGAPVFLISEADAARIVKPLEGFTAAKK